MKINQKVKVRILNRYTIGPYLLSRYSDAWGPWTKYSKYVQNGDNKAQSCNAISLSYTFRSAIYINLSVKYLYKYKCVCDWRQWQLQECYIFSVYSSTTTNRNLQTIWKLSFLWSCTCVLFKSNHYTTNLFIDSRNLIILLI